MEIRAKSQWSSVEFAGVPTWTVLGVLSEPATRAIGLSRIYVAPVSVCQKKKDEGENETTARKARLCGRC